MRRPPPPPPPPGGRRIPPPPRRGSIPRMPPPPPPKKAAKDPQASVFISTRQKMDVASMALVLRMEQVEARVQYYGADQRTNSELDAITAAVVAELQSLRIAGEDRRESLVPDVEIELIQSLRGLLEKLFSAKRRSFVERKIGLIQRRITQLFFNSELYAAIAEDGGEVSAASWPEQALYYALKQNEAGVLAELGSMKVESEEVRERAVDRYHSFTRQLCTDFLSATTPELERLLEIYRGVLADFFYGDFGGALGELCWGVVKESRVAAGHRLGYKIDASKFPAFRKAFDKHFLERLVFHVQEPIALKANESDAKFRGATLRFVADPRIHSQICEVINDSVYDYLHGEGFLDLPQDWRRVLSRS